MVNVICGKPRTLAVCAGLAAASAIAWIWAGAAFAGHPLLLGTAALAYVFGLRHAVDADHIAAIDNATRKLIEAGRPARSAGLFFALGHSTVVVLAVVAIMLAAGRLPAGFTSFGQRAGAIAAAISAASLVALALANTVVLVGVCRLFQAARRGAASGEAELARLLAQRGLLGRLLRGLFRLIGRSWHMYPLGFLFGLGFDTASEVGLLALSAAHAADGLPATAVLVFPALFAAGMTLVDTLDGIMMAGAYHWAAADPQRKLTYNLCVTALSIVVAAAIGGVEVIGLAGGAAPAALGAAAATLNRHFGEIGAAIIMLFTLTWIAALLLSRRRAGRPE